MEHLKKFESYSPMKYRFYKMDDRWYIDLPEWTSGIDDLEMVDGADILLDILSYGGNDVSVRFSDSPFEDCKTLTHKSDGYYDNDAWHGPSTIWLCSVTEFVFGKYPDHIYYK